MDFETMIRDALKNGKSLEDIASEVGATLNKVQKEANARDVKKELLEEWKTKFNSHYSKSDLDLNDVATLAVLVCEKEYSDWTSEDLSQFRTNVKASIKTLADMQTKKPGEVFDDIVKEFFGTRGKKKDSNVLTDRDRVRRFLDSL